MPFVAPTGPRGDSVNILAATASDAAQQADWTQTVIFWTCATFAVIGALGMVISRKAVHSALWVAVSMINLAVLYVALQAPFLGMVQVIVYTGAVMMLFLFVLMLVGVDSSDSIVETIKGQRLMAIVVGVSLGVALIAAVANSIVGPATGLTAANAANGGNVEGLARLMFGRYVLAFEVTSALLITAAIGAMILAHRERYAPRASQAELADSRFVLEGPKGPLPAPGVYARHNAVDTPALLPDGSIAIDSIPGSVQARGALLPIDAASPTEVQDLGANRPVLTSPAVAPADADAVDVGRDSGHSRDGDTSGDTGDGEQ